MNTIKGLFFLLGILLVWTPLSPAAEPPDPLAVMEKVDRRYDGDDREAEMTMVLIDKRGKKRIRKVKTFSRDNGEDTWSASFFISPQDVKGTGFLSYDYDKTTEDDQWLYLPALHKVKRIASNDKTASFMGSDFSYADLTDREVEDYTYTLLKQIRLNGEICHVIQTVPKTPKTVKDSGYTKSVLFVLADSLVVARAVHWLEENNRIKYYDVKKFETIQGIVAPVEIHMTLKKGGMFLHKTVIRYRNIRYNQGLNTTLFSARQLEKGF
jgi:hypothetical protein